MGILSKILPTLKNNFPSAEKTSEKSIPEISDRPTQRCPVGHSPPGGITWWRDPYGFWNCLDCHPPAADSQVREHFQILPDQPAGQGDGADGIDPESFTEADCRVGSGLEILAVFTSDGRQVFNPAITQAQRREAVNQVAWFERNAIFSTQRSEEMQWHGSNR